MTVAGYVPVPINWPVHGVPLVPGIGICLFCTCFGSWYQYLLFWRAYGVMASVRGLL